MLTGARMKIFCAIKIFRNSKIKKRKIVLIIRHECIMKIKSDSINRNKNVYWAANYHIIMISEGSCDTKHWSNDDENSDLNRRIKLHLKIYSTVILICYNISQYYCFYGFFTYQRDTNILLTPNFWTVVWGISNTFYYLLQLHSIP